MIVAWKYLKWLLFAISVAMMLITWVIFFWPNSLCKDRYQLGSPAKGALLITSVIDQQLIGAGFVIIDQAWMGERKLKLDFLGSDVDIDVLQVGHPYRRDSEESDARRQRMFVNVVFSIKLVHLAIAYTVYPAICLMIVGRRRYRRIRNPNGCSGCHYDLTGNESGTCPECGQSLATPQPNNRAAL